MSIAERMMLAHNAMRGWHRDAWSYRATLGPAAIAAIVGGFLPLGLFYWANKRVKGGQRG